MKFFFIFTIALLSFPVFSIVQNNFLTPIGGIEGITANTGIARTNSVGNVIFNPAGLAQIDTHKVSVSGSAFSQNYIDVTIGDEKEKIEYFQTTPSQITTAYSGNRFKFAMSLLVPKVSKFKNSFDVGNKQSEISYEDQETYIGPTMAFKLNNKFSIGGSAFLIKRDFSKDELLFITEDSDTAQRFYKLNITGFSFVGILGASFKPKENLHFGLKIQTPKLNLHSTYDSKVFFISTKDDVTPTSRFQDGKASFKGPAEIGFGVKYDFSPKMTILFDGAYQIKHFDLMVQSDVIGGRAFHDYQNAVRAHLAFEHEISPKETYTLGLTYNEKNEISSLSFLGATVGYRMRENVADTMFGIFVNKSIPETKDNVETNYLMAGFYLSSSINFVKN